MNARSRAQQARRDRERAEAVENQMRKTEEQRRQKERDQEFINSFETVYGQYNEGIDHAIEEIVRWGFVYTSTTEGVLDVDGRVSVKIDLVPNREVIEEMLCQILLSGRDHEREQQEQAQVAS